jgi:hypothetical protein
MIHIVLKVLNNNYGFLWSAQLGGVVKGGVWGHRGNKSRGQQTEHFFV